MNKKEVNHQAFMLYGIVNAVEQAEALFSRLDLHVLGAQFLIATAINIKQTENKLNADKLSIGKLLIQAICTQFEQYQLIPGPIWTIVAELVIEELYNQISRAEEFHDAAGPIAGNNSLADR